MSIAGCLRLSPGEADDATAQRRETGKSTPTSEPTNETSQSTITLETSIELVAPVFADAENEPIRPLEFESLPENEQLILQTAYENREDDGYSVEYGRHETPPENEKTNGLKSLIDRILERRNAQIERYREEHDDEVPEFVEAVYLEYDGEVYCIDLVDGDQRYYHC